MLMISKYVLTTKKIENFPLLNSILELFCLLFIDLKKSLLRILFLKQNFILKEIAKNFKKNLNNYTKFIYFHYNTLAFIFLKGKH